MIYDDDDDDTYMQIIYYLLIHLICFLYNYAKIQKINDTNKTL